MKNVIEQTAVHPAWFKNWFNSSFYHQLYAKRDEKEAAGFIDSLLNELQPAQNSFMLDLGCGSGRHCKYLTSKGFNVTGVDLASSSIRQAKKHENPTLRFYKHDMRDDLGKNYFDYVFNFFTSFGYFKNDQENYLVVDNISNSLKEKGMLVMDYLNVQYSEDRLVPEEEKEIDGIIYRILRWTDENFFYKKITIDNMSGDKPVEFTEQVAKLKIDHFDDMFESAGLTLEKVFGNYNLEEYDSKNSPRMIMIARK